MKSLFSIIFVSFISLASTFYSVRCNAVDLYSSFGTDADTFGDGVQEFADQLEAISRFHVRIKSPDDIGVDQTGLLLKVADGSINMAIVGIAYQDRGNVDLNLEVDLYSESFPFGLQMEEYLSWHYNGGGLSILEDILKDDGDGVVVFPVIASTGQSAGMFKGAVTQSRLQSGPVGLKMRSFGFGQEVLRKAYPNMQFIQATPGATAGIIDGFTQDLEGAEFLSPQIDNKSFFVDPDPTVQDLGVTHYYISAWQSPVTLQYLIINKKVFSRYSEKRQNLIKAAALASTQKSYARLLVRQGEALKEIENLGIKIGEFSDDILNDLLIATEAVLNEKSSLNSRFNEVLSSMKEYVRKQQSWLNDGHIDRDFRFAIWGPDWKSNIIVDE